MSYAAPRTGDLATRKSLRIWLTNMRSTIKAKSLPPPLQFPPDDVCKKIFQGFIGSELLHHRTRLIAPAALELLLAARRALTDQAVDQWGLL